MERVRQKPLDLREQLEFVDRERGLSALRARRGAGDTDDVTQIDVDRAGAARITEELDAPRTVDEVEKNQLPHLPAPHYAPRKAPLVIGLAARLEPLRLGPNGRDVVPVRETLRQPHRRASLTSLRE